MKKNYIGDTNVNLQEENETPQKDPEIEYELWLEEYEETIYKVFEDLVQYREESGYPLGEYLTSSDIHDFLEMILTD